MSTAQINFGDLTPYLTYAGTAVNRSPKTISDFSICVKVGVGSRSGSASNWKVESRSGSADDADPQY
jgi:hypothetical protein